MAYYPFYYGHGHGQNCGAFPCHGHQTAWNNWYNWHAAYQSPCCVHQSHGFPSPPSPDPSAWCNSMFAGKVPAMSPFATTSTEECTQAPADYNSNLYKNQSSDPRTRQDASTNTVETGPSECPRCRSVAESYSCYNPCAPAYCVAYGPNASQISRLHCNAESMKQSLQQQHSYTGCPSLVHSVNSVPMHQACASVPCTVTKSELAGAQSNQVATLYEAIKPKSPALTPACKILQPPRISDEEDYQSEDMETVIGNHMKLSKTGPLDIDIEKLALELLEIEGTRNILNNGASTETPQDCQRKYKERESQEAADRVLTDSPQPASQCSSSEEMNRFLQNHSAPPSSPTREFVVHSQS